MKELKLDLRALAFAWEDPNSETSYYLDLETGSLVMISPELEDVHELRQEIELFPSRFIYVPKPANNQLELDVSDFAHTIPDAKLKSMVELAMESPNRFAALRSVLAKKEGEFERWQEWRAESARQRALRFLEAHGIRAV